MRQRRSSNSSRMKIFEYASLLLLLATSDQQRFLVTVQALAISMTIGGSLATYEQHISKRTGSSLPPLAQVTWALYVFYQSVRVSGEKYARQ
jgi:hypothetical protein